MTEAIATSNWEYAKLLENIQKLIPESIDKERRLALVLLLQRIRENAIQYLDNEKMGFAHQHEWALGILQVTREEFSGILEMIWFSSFYDDTFGQLLAKIEKVLQNPTARVISPQDQTPP